jgi:hypothetical protein
MISAACPARRARECDPHINEETTMPKTRITATLIAASLGAFGAHSARADEWTGEDKKLHAIGGGAIALAMTAQTGSSLKGFAWGCGAGVAKEAFDATGQGQVSGKDLVVTCLAAAAGAGAGRFFIAPTNGGARVAVALKF